MSRSPLARYAIALLFFVGALPWIASLLCAYLGLDWLFAALDLLFAPLCHRLPERTLLLAGAPMLLCSRCAGIFAGVALGALLGLPRLRASRWRALTALAALLMTIDVIAQSAGLHPTWHALRLATGILFGYPLAAAAIAALSPRA